MTTLRSLLLLGTLTCAPAFAAEQIAIEMGTGTHWSKGADALFVRYRGDHTIPRFPRQPAFYEWSLGTWQNQHDNSALSLAIGTQWYFDRFHIDASGGLAYLARKTRLTGTHQQFLLRVGIGYKVGDFDFGIYQAHYSNAKNVFGWDGYNVGYDFRTFQISYDLK